MPPHASTDVLVVGAGPAGAWTARCLARSGAHVRIFDHSHPREKPCGGGVTGRALALIADAVTAPSLQGVTVDRGVFEDARTAPAWVRLGAATPAEASLLVVDRTRLDGALLEAAREAGARHHAERVVDVAIDGGRARVQTTAATYEASWVVGADGANSLVRRRLQRPFERRQLSIATGVFARERTETAIRVRFVAEPSGYLWSFPRADHLAIGICAQADAARPATLRTQLREWLATSGLADGARLDPYAWPIPSLSPLDLAGERPAGRGYLLVGDAAGLVDPITREGIFFALLSGQRAAEALTDGGGNPPARYIAGLQAEIYPELMRAARLKRGFFRGPFTRLLVDALRQSAAVRAVMVDLVAGVQPYRTLKGRLIRSFEWRLAWQLLRLEAEDRTRRTRGAAAEVP